MVVRCGEHVRLLEGGLDYSFGVKQASLWKEGVLEAFRELKTS